MNCCICSKEVNEKVNDIPAKWFGKFTANVIVNVICTECIQKPEGLVQWRKESK